MSAMGRLFTVVILASLLIIQPAASAPSSALTSTESSSPPAPDVATAPQPASQTPAPAAPANALADALRQGKWPAQVAASNGAIRPDLHGPQRTDPAEGIPAHAYSPFDERRNREYPCPPGGCAFVPGQLLVKLAPQTQPLPRRAQTADRLTDDRELNSALAAQGIVALTPIFPSAQSPAAGAAALTPDGATLPMPDLTRWYRATLHDASADLTAAADALSAAPGIAWAEPDYLRKPVGDAGQTTDDERRTAGADASSLVIRPSSFNDPLYPQQWHLPATNVPQAWQWLNDHGLPPGGSRDIVVAVIDTGVDLSHPDLSANLWTNSREIADNGMDDDGNGYVDDVHGADMITNSGSPLDDHGHGTHVAGIIAAQAGNGIGGVGVAYNTQIMAIKAAQYSGVLASSDIAEGIYYAAAQGADVINMSFGGYARSQLEEDALAVAFGQAVLVAAAGNDGYPNEAPCVPARPMYPGAYNWVLGVMASAQGGGRASFSNYDCIARNSIEYELLAPGVDVWSTLPNEQYAAWDGTSMAAPVISGIAALARTKWSDKDVYSSRFIMGQIAANTQGGVGGVASAVAALTVPPQPQLSYLEHWTFDTASQSAINDDDGIVDAGETIDLAIVIRNHWGKADPVTVTLEAWAAGAFQPDPYVTMVTGTVDYGTVGSFNIDDNGLIYDDQGVITGVRNPFRFTVDPNTPNDHVIPFQLTMVAGNGYDPAAAPLTFVSRFNLIVQRGRELPRIISQDMTLTKDYFWLIPDATLIEAGVHVTVTEGTQVQFWSADPNDPYSQNAKPYLQVEGTLVAGGSSDQPIDFLTGAFYTGYEIRIEQQGNGRVELTYTRVLNPRLSVTSVDHCYFAQELFDKIWARYDWGLSYVTAQVSAGNIASSVFHKLGDSSGGPLTAQVGSSNLYDSCYAYATGTGLLDNVFLKNYKLHRTQWGDRYYWTSYSSGAGYLMYQPAFLRTAFPAQYNGKTYVALQRPYNSTSENYLNLAELFANQLGGHVVTINDAAENQFLINYRNNNFNQTTFLQTYPTMNCGPSSGCWEIFNERFFIGLTDRGADGQYRWISEEPVSYTNWYADQYRMEPSSNGTLDYVYQEYDGRWSDATSVWGLVILELPGTVTQAMLDAVAIQVERVKVEGSGGGVNLQPSTGNRQPTARLADVAPFLDLPFAYTNFAEAALSNANGQGSGRVNAWFDHTSPNDTADGQLALWSGGYYTGTPTATNRDTCTAGVGCFDGHNGTDFAPIMANEPVYAAATGTVVTVTTGGRYGTQVWIDHGNGYATLYGHLASATVVTGTVISNRLAQPLGVMGYTGDAWSGTHLHFGVYFDQNNNAAWTEDEVVDPYGWIGDNADPWGMSHSYLWIHPLSVQGTIDPSSGSNTVLIGPSGHLTITVPYYAFTSTVTLELWETLPAADPSRNTWWSSTRTIGRSFLLRKEDGEGAQQNVHIVEITYRPTDTLQLQEGSLYLFRLNETNRTWESWAAGADPSQDRFSGSNSGLGHFDLQTYAPCDSREPNDSPAAARGVTTDNAPNGSYFDIPNDPDWTRLRATAGEYYLITTSELDTYANTHLELYDRDGITLLASDDNGGGGYASRIEWQAPTTGTYFIRVTPVAGSGTSCGGSHYNLRVGRRGTAVEAALEPVRQQLIAEGQFNSFKNNAILNVWWDPNIAHWMRFYINEGRDYVRYLTNNFWGTTATTLIDAAIQDYNDDFNKGLYDYLPMLTTAPTTTYPFVVNVALSTAGQANMNALNGPTPLVGAEPVTFTVTFNRDMNTAIQPAVSFGPDVPETDYTVHGIGGGWTSPRTWQGAFNITPVTGDGYQFMRIAGAVAADDPWLVTGDDSERFRFEIITSGAESMNLQATGGEGRVSLTWTQTDFDLLSGFNLYRATAQDGDYNRINTSIIPPATRAFTDTAVTPGQPYYYKFTVVKSDMTESDFSNTAQGTPLDTIPPVLAHTPVTEAPPGLPLTLYADVTDNVVVQDVILHYRAITATTYLSRTMVRTTGNRYAATVEGGRVAYPGLAYYIEATDGISTVRNGRPEYPNLVEVVDRPVVTSLSPNRGPAAGGATVTISGSNFKPGAQVTFDGAAAPQARVVSSTQMTCTTPAHFPAAADVTVTNPDTQRGTLLRGYTFESNVAALSLSHSGGGQHDIVQIPLNADNVAGLAAADLTVTFDPAVLSPRGARTGTLTPGWSLATNTGTAGQARLSLASPGGASSGTGSLALLEFEVTGAPGVTTTLRLAAAALNDGAIPIQKTDGSFTVGQVYRVAGVTRFWNGAAGVPAVAFTLDGDRVYTAIGDPTGAYTVTGARAGSYTLTPGKTDGANGITAYDASLALQHAAGLAPLSGYGAAAGDVNRNGAISSMDAFYILQGAVDLIPLPFPGAGLVWAFDPAGRSYPALNSNQAGQDFTAVLLGDISGNWSASPALAAASAPAAGPAITLTVRTRPADPAGQTAVELAVDAGTVPLYSLDLALAYVCEAAPCTPAAVAAVQPGPLADGLAHAVNLTEPGAVRVALAGALPITGRGVLLTIRLHDARPGSLVRSDANEGRVPVQVVYGSGGFQHFLPLIVKGDGRP